MSSTAPSPTHLVINRERKTWTAASVCTERSAFRGYQVRIYPHISLSFSAHLCKLRIGVPPARDDDPDGTVQEVRYYQYLIDRSGFKRVGDKRGQDPTHVQYGQGT